MRGPLLFDIYILFDLIYLSEFSEVCNFVNDTTFYSRGKELRSLIDILETDGLFVIE